MPSVTHCGPTWRTEGGQLPHLFTLGLPTSEPSGRPASVYLLLFTTTCARLLLRGCRLCTTITSKNISHLCAAHKCRATSVGSSAFQGRQRLRCPPGIGWAATKCTCCPWGGQRPLRRHRAFRSQAFCRSGPSSEPPTLPGLHPPQHCPPPRRPSSPTVCEKSLGPLTMQGARSRARREQHGLRRGRRPPGPRKTRQEPGSPGRGGRDGGPGGPRLVRPHTPTRHQLPGRACPGPRGSAPRTLQAG